MSIGRKLDIFFNETKPRNKTEADLRGAVTVAAVGTAAVVATLGIGGVFNKGLDAEINNYPRVDGAVGLIIKDGATAQSNPGRETAENYVGEISLASENDTFVPGEVHAWYGGSESSQDYCVTHKELVKALGNKGVLENVPFGTSDNTPACFDSSEAKLVTADTQNS